MEGSLLRKDVVFLGTWRTSRLDDRLAWEIASKAQKTKGQSAQLEIRTMGARLYTRNGTQNSMIRMPNVQDIILNRYDPGCVLCVLREGRYLNILVCRCFHVRDSSDILKSFRASKRDDHAILNEMESKQLWSLQQSLYRTERQPKKSRNRMPDIQGHKSAEVCHVGVQVTPGDSDNVSLSPSSIKSNDLREELSHLSEEVKAIKILLEKSAGEQNDKRITYKTPQSDIGTKGINKVIKPQSLETPTITRGDFVSAKSPGYPSEYVDEEDAHKPPDVTDACRSSVGAMDSGVRSFSVTNSSVFCENDNTEYRHSDNIYRLTSADTQMSIPLEEDFLRHKNPSSFSGKTRLTTYITAPPGFQTRTVPLRNRAHTTPGRLYSRQSQAKLSTTVRKSIENVYPNNIRSAKTVKRRSRQIISPETFVVNAKERRPRSSSAHDPSRRRVDSEDMELRRSLYNLYNEA